MENKVKKLRMEKGWTQAELAARSGIKRAYISQIENNKNSINMNTISKLIQAMDCKIGDLF